MKIFIAVLMLLPALSFALEVDEKLTVRVVRTSETRKTIMINRGTEDGIVEGDHARFIVTAGVVARAVCVRTSPTRSIWSVYRLVNADFIVPDAVMTLKITPPVKITKDETQTLVQEDVPTRAATDPAALGIPLAEGAQDIDPAAAPQVGFEDEDMRGLEEVTIAQRNMEVFGILNISGLTSTTSASGSDSFRDAQSYHHIGLGAEYYPQRERQWYSRFSVMGGVNLMRLNSQAYQGSAVSNDVTEFELGLNWHPWTRPSATLSFIPYFHVSGSMGSVKSTAKGGAPLVSATQTSANGTTNGLSIGFGYKFYTRNGFGARALFDYYQRGESYTENENGLSFTKLVSGPRLLFGISYRF